MVAFAAVLLTAVVSQAVPPAPPPNAPPPTGLIVGRVLDGSTNRPIAGAVVSLDGGAIGPASPGRTVPRALTSSSGQFVFRKVPKGSYQLRATRAGYADGSYGQRRPGGVSGSLALADAQRVGDAIVLIWKHATISGTVVDEAGDPLIGVQIRAFQRRFAAGRVRLTQASTAATDDRGFYRFPSLVPGDYLLAFVWREASVPTAINDPSVPLVGFDGIRTARPGPDGRFEFGQIAPGPYVLFARAAMPPAPGSTAPQVLAASMDVDVQSADQHDLALVLEDTLTLSGIVRFDGDGAAPALRGQRVLMQPPAAPNGVTVSSGGAIVNADGTFTISGVTPGRYHLTLNTPPQLPWVVRSATIAGQDALDAVVDVRQSGGDAVITITDRITSLHGRVDASSGTDYTMVLSRRTVSTGRRRRVA